MNVSRFFLLFLVLTLVASVAVAQNEADMAAAMAAAQKYTEPGEHHRSLERFLGTWNTEMRFKMAGMDQMPPDKGQITTSWLVEGRWLKSEGNLNFMGMPMKTFEIMGYDNFKQSFVLSRISSLDTAMHYAEGDLDQTGDVLLMYGQLDEYLTGEHDKMVQTITRIVSPNKIVIEVNDLPIGEKNNTVLEFVMTRAEETGK